MPFVKILFRRALDALRHADEAWDELMQTGSGAVLPVTGPEAQDEVSDEFVLDEWEVAVGSVGPVTRQRQ
ncbi:MAG: hypothetical protein RL347_2273 [Actinomycetota bacterium]